MIILTPVSVGRLVGGYLRHDWLAAIFIAVALLSRHRPIGAGIAFGYAAMTRVFPFLLLVGLVVPIVRRSLESRRIHVFDRRFVTSFLVFCAFAVGAGCLTGRGCSAWGDWIDKMRVHNREAPFWNRSTGLKHFFVHDLGDFSDASFETDPTSRRNTLDRQKSWYLGSAAIYLTLLSISLSLSRSDINAVLLSSVVVFVLVVSSHYYWAIFGLLPLWIDDARDPKRVVSLVATLAALLVPTSAYWFFLHHDIKFQRGVFVDLLLGVGLLAVMATHIWRSRASARVW